MQTTRFLIHTRLTRAVSVGHTTQRTRTHSYLFTTISCLIVMSAPVAATLPGDNLTATSDAGVRRLLKGGGEVVVMGDSSVAGMTFVGDSSWVGGGVWFSLSMSIFTMMPYCAITAFGLRLSLHFSLPRASAPPAIRALSRRDLSRDSVWACAIGLAHLPLPMISPCSPHALLMISS